MKKLISNDFLEEMMNSKFVKEKELSNGVCSYNFTRDAFFKKEWNHMTTKARGLFIHKESKTIVARSYEKFFNVNEFDHCSVESLEKMNFPVEVFVKENGFLGILGYNHSIDELMFCSKSTDDHIFAGYFKDLFEQKYGDKKELIKNYLKNNHVSFVFEVIDMINDPHIIDYANSELVLLDIIYNSIEFDHYSYDDLVSFAKSNNIKVKEKALTLNSYQEFVDFYKMTAQENYLYNGRNIEGFVLEDSNKYMVKIKCYYYSFWKRIRGYCMRIQKGNVEKILNESKTSEKNVLDFIIKNNLANENVIKIAKMYELEKDKK